MPSHYRDRQPLVMRLWVLDERGNKLGADIKFLVDRGAQLRREKKRVQHKLAKWQELLRLPKE